MLADMLAALAPGRSVRRVHVTTPTPALSRIAARAGAVVVLEHGADDLSCAFDRVRRRIAASDPDATVMLLPGDLPGITLADIDACLAAAGSRRVVLAPATADGGTGGLVLRAGVAFPLAFGPGSFAEHLAATRALGLRPIVVRTPGLGFDIDRPADLDAFLAQDGAGRTADLLRDARIAA